jgi:streptomycin 6-kinase
VIERAGGTGGKGPISLALSGEFRQRILSVWGERGKAWLDHLPALVETCAQQWRLSIQAPLPALSYGFAAFAVRADGTEAVLKISVPNPELHTEIEALRLFRGRPVVELLEADPAHGALLLKRLDPGLPLSQTPEDEATVIAAHLMRQLRMPEPVDHAFPTVARWGLAFDRLRARFDGKTGPLPRRLVEKAERLLEELQASSPRRALLHGDLHHDNILSDGGRGWVAIDPKGVIGDPAYEAARFQHNPIPGFLSEDAPRAVARRRVDTLSSILRVDPSRLLAWAFFDTVLAACWSIEENGHRLRYHLSCAEVFDGLVE